MHDLKDSPLGKNIPYVETYSRDLLFAIPRSWGRDKIGLSFLPFEGEDIWNSYELSWLNPNGKPQVAVAEFRIPCTTKNIIESKSLKHYLNSLNQTHFSSLERVRETLVNDLSLAVEAKVSVTLTVPDAFPQQHFEDIQGINLDDLDIETHVYQISPAFLITLPQLVKETVFTNLLKWNCLGTGQPDWGSLLIRYAGPQIDHEGLLKYIISYRQHNGFIEPTVEQIYFDILTCCRPERLTVYARFSRRGGIDINPFRSNFEQAPSYKRTFRQ